MNRNTWIIIIVVVIVIIGLIWIFNRGPNMGLPPSDPAVAPSVDLNASHWIGYNTWIIVDPQTNCQYLATSAGGIVPRLDAGGKHVCHLWSDK